ncbi:MAG: group III truncated hemoglobin ['Candidatus Kapabacteria' thiocyanatum]|nr:group III truncated hemoglobin ['Candidatus Kapabacteria' thiocyanatum]
MKPNDETRMDHHDEAAHPGCGCHTHRRIESRDDVRLLVHTFYDRVRADDILAPVFALRIKGSWDEHLERMTSFWSNLLLNEPGFKGNPLQRHMGLPLNHDLFERWLKLWEDTVTGLFTGDIAHEAITKARNIADVFMMRLLPPVDPRSLIIFPNAH